ncbi:hypothetical protein EXIGLDRAFT_139618 [Exidia glandulosa HHB12029]|uniref:Uncharacterized protein n=1 Tax=Exidia glandulosa HHB12029 TaxID=1314781 RepID=A0A165FWG0_EXIGL|nr:hypothetical protein EXIGLDRAFT_139618 [Exidia glandulosa HHB12029]
MIYAANPLSLTLRCTSLNTSLTTPLSHTTPASTSATLPLPLIVLKTSTLISLNSSIGFNHPSSDEWEWEEWECEASRIIAIPSSRSRTSTARLNTIRKEGGKRGGKTRTVQDIKPSTKSHCALLRPRIQTVSRRARVRLPTTRAELRRVVGR